MSSPSSFASIENRRDWRTALGALRQLLANGDDTAQVFRIMRALNAGTARRNYLQLLDTPEGGRIAYERVELARRLAEPAYVDRFAEGTVGAAYRDFLRSTGYSAEGLVDVSRTGGMEERDAEHPYAWFGRRQRDTHDIWHVLTGYAADEHLGEACLVAFSYAQTHGLGWALIALGATFKALRMPNGRVYAAAIWEGYRRGRSAKWLAAEDYDRLMAEPLASARERLGLGEPIVYRQARTRLGGTGARFRLMR
ncbi:Coq4 family protein [Flavisphingomonas formosensis]|uniref:Coq4 family protein n=1 Tax=Flavisphingomonas formosensis TaxID=861534 RepID=UPI0012F7117D|nr:Coq4 family protein [Sphingomonas formosensis]